jgi:hypothetical protein
LTALSSVGEFLIVASVVCMCPVGADPKGTLKYVPVNNYNSFLLTSKKYQTKIFIKENSTVDQCPTPAW